MIEAYPLSWPVGYKRSKFPKSSPFRQSADKAQSFLRDEIRKLGGTGLIISTNVMVRRDGFLYSDMMNAKLDDPGVAIYFKYKNKDVSMCCDQYERVWENIYALGKGIEALRGMERWGVSEFLDRAFTGFKALPETVAASVQTWFETLGVPPTTDAIQIKDAYRKLAQIHHPDAGGDTDKFAKLTKAYQEALSQLNS